MPEEPLLPGVEYTARVRSGDEGVLGRGGAPLENDGDTWCSWRFTTRVDMEPETNGGQLLACHLYQTARDVPLILGKPAIARVFANWEPQSGVHPEHQVREFEARVVVTDGTGQVETSKWHRFVRPDLWASRGIHERAAEHTAQVRFEPRAEGLGLLRVDLEVRSSPGAEPQRAYDAYCPTRVWDLEPELTIDFAVLRVDEWKEDPARFSEEILPTLQAIADASVEYAWQLFPFAEVHGSRVREITTLEYDACRCPTQDEGEDALAPARGCSAEACARPAEMVGMVRLDDRGAGVSTWYLENWSAETLSNGGGGYAGLRDRLAALSSADVVVVFLPPRLTGGGNTGRMLADGRGVVLSIASDRDEHFSRYVEGTVHELGHVLDLQHLPTIADGMLPSPIGRRSRSARRQLPFEYKGIEGLRMSRDGDTCWNKSSQEGNEQNVKLFALMSPATVSTDQAFIANHHYRQIQRLLEGLP